MGSLVIVEKLVAMVMIFWKYSMFATCNISIERGRPGDARSEVSFLIFPCCVRYTTKCKMLLVAMETKYTVCPIFQIREKTYSPWIFLEYFDILRSTVYIARSWNFCNLYAL